ncbi:MAG: DotU family type IV/VI secretion system protein [Candidatus Eisenbacteria bacterium]|uniref:DotU family type IV/VI secretion system protein n=1 Tax=Eiseniibacteriota bacterium TaxID=2212470 RepID=A0A948RYB2_UNCEI|nr:DotU family type IV/VI secretion system protein [Candidatus Eisenbacteria bacterium]MBU1948765.1 DotU family type IV/VI secretion system protein [Candidatus Eisenbacteria bacterium]MBU2692206.1 DotU family type IV/VI secretion system protein [Candidatus Eisenbacteria bacterium]
MGLGHLFNRSRKTPEAGFGAGGDPSRPSAALATTRTLSTLSSDLFSFIVTLRTRTDLGEPGDIRNRILDQLGRFEKEGKEAGYSTQQVDEARFAIVALLDEAILNSQWPGKNVWRSTKLQSQLFGINIAGEEFFKRLDRLRMNPGENRPALEVYHDALVLGFSGRYVLSGPEKRDALLLELARELTGDNIFMVEKLSPHWKRPDDFPEVVGEGFPIWATALLFIPAMALLIIVFGLVARIAGSHAADEIRSLLATIGF